MPATETTVRNAIQMLLLRRGSDVDVRDESKLQDDLGLDSLELAELSAILEDELGSDPYTHGLVPNTVGEVLAFYAT